MSPRLREAAVADDPYRSFAEGIGQTPVWVFHGSNDESVAESRRVVNAFTANGNANVKYTEYENAGHGIVGRVFREPELFQWLMAQHLDNLK